MPGPWGWGPIPCGMSSTQHRQNAPSLVSSTALPPRTPSFFFTLLIHSRFDPIFSVLRGLLYGLEAVVCAKGMLLIFSPGLPPGPALGLSDRPLTVKFALTRADRPVGTFLKHEPQRPQITFPFITPPKPPSSPSHDSGNVSRTVS